MVRIGYGYDAHRLGYGRKLILGGVDTNYPKGLVGHSDADVLVHAICDALLGAAALGDIGVYFPDSDPQYEGISSLIILKKTAELLSNNGYSIVNIDATVVAQDPKIAPFVLRMRENVADACGADIGRISIKGTTEEQMGFTGAHEGICAHAACLISSK